MDTPEDEDTLDDRTLLSDLDLSSAWLYAWGDLPTTLAGLRHWLNESGIDVEDFKNSGRFEANYDRFPWLKDL